MGWFQELKESQVEVERVTWENAAEVEWDLIRPGFEGQGEDLGLSPECAGSKGGFQQGAEAVRSVESTPETGRGFSFRNLHLCMNGDL